MNLREQLRASLAAESHNHALRYTVQCARRSHGVAVWSRNMARRFPDGATFHNGIAAKCFSEAKQFMADARQMRAET